MGSGVRSPGWNSPLHHLQLSTLNGYLNIFVLSFPHVFILEMGAIMFLFSSGWLVSAWKLVHAH